MKGVAPRRIKDCQDPWTGVVIGSNGDVAPCCHAPQRMGNLGEEELDAIWDGPRFRTFRAFLQSPTPLPVCDTCFVRGWKTEAPPPAGKPRTALRKLLARLGIGRTEPRLKVWTDPGVHRPGEPLILLIGFRRKK